jgi:hypothetical protein
VVIDTCAPGPARLVNGIVVDRLALAFPEMMVETDVTAITLD